MFYNLIISPIETIIDLVFNFIIIKFSSFGIIGAVCGVSITINFLALPLYNIADSLQDKERTVAKALEPRVKRIKKAFKGNEQFMMLSTYYKENDYHPFYVLRSSISILIEIPFFIAAYHYLSNCEALKNASFWIFKDLGSPDGLLHIRTFPIHILPIIMTLINFVSGAIYTKEAPFREKIQLYIVAALFLVLLYNSPSGLVIYWILNNLFSLIKNIVMKIKNPGTILHIILSGLLLTTAAYFFTRDGKVWKKIFFLSFSILITLLPVIKHLFSKLPYKFKVYNISKNSIVILFLCGLGLAILCGLLLPASLIATSPREFSYLGQTESPLSYLYTSFTIFLGLFVFWPCLIYFMFDKKIKHILISLFLILFLVAFTNAFVCKPDLSEITSILTYDINSVPKYIHFISFSSLFLGLLLLLITKKIKKNILSLILISICIAEFSFSYVKISAIKASFSDYKVSKVNKSETESKINETISPIYNLSKTGNNVIIIFLDRAIGSFEPYIFENIEGLKEQYEGFTYYPNTLSFGRHTVFGFPPMAGGYEYTQENINKRESELLVSKHNEAMLVMPKLFSDAGFDVTFTDPPFSNYKWKGDLTPFESLPGIHVTELEGNFSQKYKKEINYIEKKRSDYLCRKNIIAYSIIQILPPLFRPIFYNFGVTEDKDYSRFFDQFSTLYYLPNLTSFTNVKNSFIFMDNETCHEPIFLNPNNYLEPSFQNFSALGSYNPFSTAEAADFITNTAALIQLGKWFNFLRENDCYDNTRIIIVSDHGYNHRYSDFKKFKDPTIPSSYNPLFMVKDFNCHSPLSTNNSFMTNADTIFFAKKDLNTSNINPFTKIEFKQEKENIHVYPQGFDHENNGEAIRDKTQFILNKNEGWNVSKNIFDEKNWIPLTEWEETFGGNN